MSDLWKLLRHVLYKPRKSQDQVRRFHPHPEEPSVKLVLNLPETVKRVCLAIARSSKPDSQIEIETMGSLSRDETLGLFRTTLLKVANGETELSQMESMMFIAIVNAVARSMLMQHGKVVKF